MTKLPIVHPKLNHEESQIQSGCVKWFNLQHRALEGLLFAVPNGGGRSRIEAAIMIGEGVYPGVADLLLLVPRGKWHGLAIEMKTENGRQSPAQKEWERKIEEQGYAYAICRSVDEFIELIEDYLK